MVAVGIDLGTTYSAVAVQNEDGHVTVLKNSDGNTVTPSVLYFQEDGSVLVGEEAKAMLDMGDENVASFFKRRMGDTRYTQRFHGRNYSATDLSAILLEKLKKDAEAALGEPITGAVITVPAYFDDAPRKATVEAAERAGLKVLRIINEPTSAALAYGLKNFKNTQTVMVYDLGGGTFDVSLVQISENEVRVLATDGDHALGGRDWDERLIRYVVDQFQHEYGMNPLEDAALNQELLIRSENAKRQLSRLQKTTLKIVYNGERASYEITQPVFEGLCEDLLYKTQTLCESVLTSCNPPRTWADLDGVLLVGGSTRMPMVERLVERLSGRKPLHNINVDEAVAIGAAMQAATEVLQAEENTSHGLQRTGTRAAAAGLVKIRDVTSHSLGAVAISTDGKRYINEIIIPKNSAIPCTEKKSFKMRVPRTGGTQEVYMLQGENSQPLSCVILGKYVFSEIMPEKGSEAEVEISYTYNQNGVVEVEAFQQAFNKKLPLTIEPVPADLSWLAEPPKAEMLQQSQPVSVILMIDTSGSMAGMPFDEAKKAAIEMVNKFDLKMFSVGVIGFGDRNDRKLQPSQDYKAICQAIRTLSGQIGTVAIPFDDGMSMKYHLDESIQTESRGYFVILTDGLWYHQRKSIKIANQCKKAGIEIIAIGFGDADEAFLREIASCEANAIYTDLSQLVQSFSKIGQSIAEQNMGIRRM